jgi:hypothetical protein
MDIYAIAPDHIVTSFDRRTYGWRQQNVFKLLHPIQSHLDARYCHNSRAYCICGIQLPC